jgi:hypothetical protein
MEIGDSLIYEGRTYVLIGLEPMSVPERKADLRDVETGDVITVPCTILEQRRKGLAKDP